MANTVQPEKFIKALMISTQIMYGNREPDQTLEQVFNKNFYPALGFDHSVLAKQIDIFYDEIFPTLSSLTTPRPEAVNLVEWAFAKGWDVSIATDPLFPRKAILHRLSWAGLPVEKYPFTLISDFHKFHFAKASVSYYPEFLAYLKWDDDPVLMVGDSLERDVISSHEAGLPVFWLTTEGQKLNNGFLQGDYLDLKKFLESSDLSEIKVNNKTPKSMLAFLQATPAVLHSILLDSAPDKRTKRSPEGEWALLDIICHLRDVDREVNITRVDSILRENNVFINGQPTDQWAEERHYFEQDIEIAFSEFVIARLKLIDALAHLEKTDWERKARHAFLGPTTLAELIGIVVDHDRLHIKQAQKAVA